jgi:hypothetical protein
VPTPLTNSSEDPFVRRNARKPFPSSKKLSSRPEHTVRKASRMRSVGTLREKERNDIRTSADCDQALETTRCNGDWTASPLRLILALRCSKPNSFSRHRSPTTPSLARKDILCSCGADTPVRVPTPLGSSRFPKPEVSRFRWEHTRGIASVSKGAQPVAHLEQLLK